MPFCKYCGAEISPNAVFCKKCGKSLTPANPAGAPQPQPTTARPVTPQQPAPQPQQAYAAPQPQQPHVAPQPQQAYAAPQPQQPHVAPQPQQPYAAPQAQQPYAAPQQPQPAPAYQAPPQGNAKQKQSKQKKSKFSLIVTVISLLIGAGGLCLRFIEFNKNNSSQEADSTATQQVADSSKSQEPTAIAETPAAPEPAAEPVATPEPAPAPEPAPVAATPTPSAAPATPAPAPAPKVTKPAPSQAAPATAPTDADFKGWYIGNAQVKGKPKGVTSITDLAAVSGSWKALFFQDPKNKYGVKAYTYATVNISGKADQLKFIVNRYTTRFLTTKETLKESSVPDVYKAKWSNGKLIASGAGSVTITSFWEQNGKKYAIGTYDSPDGMPVSVGLVRP